MMRDGAQRGATRGIREFSGGAREATCAKLDHSTAMIPGSRADAPGRRGRRPVGLFVFLVVTVAAIMVFSGVAGVYRAPPTGHGPTRVAEGVPSLSISPTSGAPGTTVTVTISDFTPYGQTEVFFNNTTVPTYSIASDPFFYLNSTGGFSGAFSPVSTGLTAGTYEFSANDPGTGESFSASFEVTSSTTTLSATPSVGCAGASISVSGSGFYGDLPYYVYLGPIASSPGYEAVTEGTTSGNGEISNAFTVPSLASGSYTLFAEDAVYNYAATSFSCVGVPSVTLSPSSGPMGITDELTGADFASDSAITATVTPNNAGSTPICPSTTTDSSGGFTCTFVVPPSSGATSELVSTTDASSDSAQATFDVTGPVLTMVPASGEPGSTLKVEGAGFAPGATFQATFSSTNVGCSATVQLSGDVSCSLVVPLMAPEVVLVAGSDDEDNAGSSYFHILGLPTAEFPAYLLQINFPTGGPWPGVKLGSRTGLLLNNWNLNYTTFEAGTNLTTDSVQLYNVSNYYRSSLFAFIIGSDPNSTGTPMPTVIQEPGAIDFEPGSGNVLSVQPVQGGSGDSATPVINFAITGTKPMHGPPGPALAFSLAYYGPPKGYASAVPEPAVIYPAVLMDLVYPSSNAYSNPITIDGVSGSWVYSWELSEAGKGSTGVLLNVTIAVSMVNILLAVITPLSQKISFTLYAFSNGQTESWQFGIIKGHETGPIPVFNESASAGAGAVFYDSYTAASVS